MPLFQIPKALWVLQLTTHYLDSNWVDQLLFNYWWVHFHISAGVRFYSSLFSKLPQISPDSKIFPSILSYKKVSVTKNERGNFFLKRKVVLEVDKNKWHVKYAVHSERCDWKLAPFRGPHCKQSASASPGRTVNECKAALLGVWRTDVALYCTNHLAPKPRWPNCYWDWDLGS
jgi:hypothetical protein